MAKSLKFGDIAAEYIAADSIENKFERYLTIQQINLKLDKANAEERLTSNLEQVAHAASRGESVDQVSGWLQNARFAERDLDIINGKLEILNIVMKEARAESNNA